MLPFSFSKVNQYQRRRPSRTKMGFLPARDITLAFFGGFLVAVILILVVGITVLRNSDVYGLGHWKLNIKMPVATLWMNLGYWCVTWPCSATLDEIM